MAKTYKTSYGLDYKLLSKSEWKKARKNLSNEYDRSIGDMHVANSGFAILDTKYNQPIDNEYDLGEIYQRIGNQKKNASAKAMANSNG